MIYPDSDDTTALGNGTDGIYDRIEMKYNRLGQVTERQDQIQTAHKYEYDKLGRLTHDLVSSVGSGVNNTVRRITRTYEVRGMLDKISSYDNATPGSGSVLNEVQMTYNTFGQLEKEYQALGGAVNTGTSPYVE